MRDGVYMAMLVKYGALLLMMLPFAAVVGWQLARLLAERSREQSARGCLTADAWGRMASARSGPERW
jgi:hypothetical protein